MTGAEALGCPECRRTFGALEWREDGMGRCRYCLTDLQIVPYPALSRRRAAAVPQAVAVAEDATCFFHPQNQAEQVCGGCGRFLCAVCSIPTEGRAFCPSCVSSRARTSDVAIPRRTLFESIALSLAIAPLLLWFITFLTAPVALGLVIYGWNKPGSLVHGRRRWRLVAAGLIALAQIGVWCYVGANLWLK